MSGHRGTTSARSAIDAGVTQLAECLLPKQDVVGSNPIARSRQKPGISGRYRPLVSQRALDIFRLLTIWSRVLQSGRFFVEFSGCVGAEQGAPTASAARLSPNSSPSLAPLVSARSQSGLSSSRLACSRIARASMVVHVLPHGKALYGDCAEAGDEVILDRGLVILERRRADSGLGDRLQPVAQELGDGHLCRGEGGTPCDERPIT